MGAWRLNAPPPDFEDRFYQDINYSWDVYRALKAWQESLYGRDDYRDVIFSFAQNLLVKTGSREVKRATRSAGPPEIRSIRAIPHNAILQQMGAPVNVAGGIGSASGREADRFVEHANNSPRMRDLLRMTAHARDLTSITIMRAYASLYAPSYWSSLAGLERRSAGSEIYENVLQALQSVETGAALSTLADFLARDLRKYDGVRDAMNEPQRAANGAGVHVDLGVLHALRQALIAHAAAVAASAPPFSRRHDVDRGDILEMALALRLSEAASMIAQIFPKESPADGALAQIEETADENPADMRAYPDIHQRIVTPLRAIDKTLKHLSAAIANHYGAYG